MNKFQTFYFENFEFNSNNLKAKFFYSFDEKEIFVEEIDFKNDNFISSFLIKENTGNIMKGYGLDLKLNNLLFNAHIALGISYYKLFPTKNLIIKSGFLTEEQKKFWKKFYLNGLGEFFIKNNFDFKDILNFKNKGQTQGLPLQKICSNKYYVHQNSEKSLLMWGGGKDSIVSSIILEEKKQDFDTFVFGKIDNIKSETIKILGKKTMLVKRKLSTNLFELNKKGYYNGHVPITGIIAFISLISAYLYNYKNIVLSNEASACEENIIWKGIKINHQYSKSLEFENDFRNYLKNYIGDINYYSLLRDKFELEIAEIFSQKAQKYFYSFSSCNKNFKINSSKQQNKKWCCECEKCAFVYLILAGFLEEKEMLKIFGENLLEKKDLEKTYKELLGLGKNKPFECVGTYKESRISFKKLQKIYKNKIKSGIRKKMPYILENIEI